MTNYVCLLMEVGLLISFPSGHGCLIFFIDSFLLKHKGLALPALQICLEAFTWTDSEAVTKVSSFCAHVVLLAIATNSVELQEFVSKDLFYAIIKGLELESNAVISADLVGLCREIFIYLRDRDPAPRQVIITVHVILMSWIELCW